MATGAKERADRARLALVAVFAALFSVHLLLSGWPHARGLLHSEVPTWAEHPRQVIGAQTSAELLAARGSPWGYDPRTYIGVPNVAVVTDSHAQTAIVVLLRGLGVGRAYSLWAALGVATIPLVLLLAGRTAAGSAAGWWTGTSAIVLLHLDPLTRTFTRTGIQAWLLSSAIVVLFTATFAELLEAPTRRRWAAVLAILPLLCVHVLCPPTIAAAFLLTLGLRLRRPDDRRGALTRAAVVAGVGLLLNLWWVAPLLRHMWVFDTDAWGVSMNVHLDQLPLDLLNAVWPGVGYLGGALGVRWAAVALGLLGARARTSASARALGGLALLGVGVAYVGSDLPGVHVIEPYRVVVVAMFAGVALVGPGLEALAEGCRGGRPAPRVAAGLLLVALLLSGGTELRAALTEPLRPRSLDADDHAALRALALRPAERGRLLVENMTERTVTSNAAALALERHAHLCISGETFFGAFGRITWVSFPPNFLGRDPLHLRPEEVPRLLEHYAVGTILARSRWGWNMLDEAPAGTFSNVEQYGHWRLYDVARPSGWFAAGSGRLEVGPGRLSLAGLTGPVVVRFQHVPRLRAEEAPDVLVEAWPVPGERVSFIRVDPRGRDTVTLVWDG